MVITIRPYVENDQEAVVRLWDVCDLIVPWNDPAKDIARTLTQQREMFLVAEHEGRIVGSVMAGFDGHRGAVNYLAVEPTCRKLGIGRRLMSEAERMLKEAGCPKINVMVRNSNIAATEFYAGIGYEPAEVVVYGKRLIADCGGGRPQGAG
jgi:ribosomal protein S18 acetylase RimI-like enzyme